MFVIYLNLFYSNYRTVIINKFIFIFKFYLYFLGIIIKLMGQSIFSNVDGDLKNVKIRFFWVGSDKHWCASNIRTTSAKHI